ncbi:unnamed protein product, partial [Vitis vinifera]
MLRAKYILKKIIFRVIKNGICPDSHLWSSLVNVYVKCESLQCARQVLEEMPIQDVQQWNQKLSSANSPYPLQEAVQLFYLMRHTRIRLNQFIFASLISAAASLGDNHYGESIHACVCKYGFESDILISNAFVTMYMKTQSVENGWQFFKAMMIENLASRNNLLSGFCDTETCDQGPRILIQLLVEGFEPNMYTFISILKTCASKGDLNEGKAIHGQVIKSGINPDSHLWNSLVNVYAKCGSANYACKVFGEIPERDVVSWTALITGFVAEGYGSGLRIFNQMLAEGFNPNMYTFISILRSCSSLSDVDLGKQVHAQIVKNSLDGNDFVGTALVDMYAKNRFLEDAETIFNRLIKRDLFAWTVIVAGYAQDGQGEKAVKCFIQMQREGVKPNEFTLASSLSGCSRIATLDSGRQLHSMAIKAGQSGDMFVASALVDMYAKCGCVEDAEVVFDGLVSRDTVSWNTIICGYSQHGQGGKALKAFEAMLDEGTVPDEVTFIGVLSACSHMGLIEEGKKHFNSLSKIYGITPTIEHYACMVDILGRAGKFHEVESFIEEMKLTSNVLIWETVLGACKMHGNIEFGERAAMKLFELEPEIDSNYILLSNMFAAKGMWDDVTNVRALMSTRGVKKEPGCSWVEVNGQVHVFLSHDGSHPKIREIHLKLQDLHQKLMSVGYTPNTDHVLHNVSDREKQELLFYHSERLALAFALLSTSTRKTIRIFKNLRICGDCHDFMKSISEITNQELVVRDINCFHHFKNGSCSCQNFW